MPCLALFSEMQVNLNNSNMFFVINSKVSYIEIYSFSVHDLKTDQYLNRKLKYACITHDGESGRPNTIYHL